MRLGVREIPAILQAFGYYPSMYEVEDIVNEVHLANVMESSTYNEQVTFDELIKCKSAMFVRKECWLTNAWLTVYLNHRPVEQYTDEAIVSALNYAKPLKHTEDRISKRDLLQFLQEYGNPLFLPLYSPYVTFTHTNKR
jgi:hypothetical protein